MQRLSNGGNQMQWPEGKSFAFTVFDDTDHATVAKVKPVYDLLAQLGMRTTKSVWVYPSRGRFAGQSLSDPDYLAWIRQLQAQGFEIGSHGVGDGAFSRAEILAGMEAFRDWLGSYPRIHANHVGNPDNLYWLKDRFDWPVSALYGLYCRLRKRKAVAGCGSRPDSEHFWGDFCKAHIDYIRNYTCGDIDTLAFDPFMPYLDPHRSAYANRWFSSSDGHTVAEFCGLLSPEGLARLRGRGGACIVYTHFACGFVDAAGQVVPEVRSRLEQLAALDGYFEPVSTVLDHLRARQGAAPAGGRPSSGRWLADRIVKKIRYGR